jgi:hypothetical protein
LAEVTEGSGTASGDAIGGESPEDTLEGAMDVETGIGTGEKRAEFGGKVFFDGSAAAVELGVRAAEVAIGGGHAALASVGEFEVAEVIGVVLSSHSGERIANTYYIVNITGTVSLGTIYARVRIPVEKEV